MSGQTAVGLFSIAVLFGALGFAFWRSRGVKRDPDKRHDLGDATLPD